MKKNTQNTYTYFRLVLGFIGENTNSYCGENFTTEKEAREYFQREYKNRCKNDEYDTYGLKNNID